MSKKKSPFGDEQIARKYYLTTMPKIFYKPARQRDSGFGMIAAIVVIMAIILGITALTTKALDGLLASINQGSAKDARLVAEAGIAEIISEWNMPANRLIYQGIPMSQWTTSNSVLKNRCTAPSPGFVLANALPPESTALQFANGNEISLQGDSERRFILKKATFISRNRANIFATSPSSDSVGTPGPIGVGDRGFLVLEVEGRVFNGNRLIASSTISREFEVEAKCCDRSFGGSQKSDAIYGNDSRSCKGKSEYQLVELAIVAGLRGGGYESGTGSGSLQVTLQDGNTPLDEIICIPPTGETACGGTLNASTVRTKDGPLDVSVKPIFIPDPPPAPAALTSSREITSSIVIKGSSTNSADATCVFAKDGDGATDAYQCRISSVSLASNTLTIDTSDYPVYLYLDGPAVSRSSAKIDVNGNGRIRHVRCPAGTANCNTDAPITDSNRFQIRGFSSCSGGGNGCSQTFSFAGNGTSAMTIWAPYAYLTITGTATYGGILWANDIKLGGTGETIVAIPSNSGTCVLYPSASPCEVLDDSGNDTAGLAPTEWTARSITFTRMF